ncbi:MAG: sensor domain-containing diguanylate cyclase [Hansschlegelia sp.]
MAGLLRTYPSEFPDAADPTNPTEHARLAALGRLDIMDTPREEAFDRLTRLARKIFRASMSTVTLLDGHRQWFKSQDGLDCSETPRDIAFCNLTIRQPQLLIIEDAALDPRFATNPLVTGPPHIRFYAGAPLQSLDGFNVGTLCVLDHEPRVFDERDRAILADLAEIATSELELRLLANVDALTGAMSRRAFREGADRAIGLARRHRHDLSLIVFDLDRFKSVNDTHGHPAGDRVLKGSVEACAAELRASDLIGRLGGEEFAILLPHTGSAAALEVAERLMAALSKPRYGAKGAEFGVTASFGVASLSRSMGDIDKLMELADGALLEAKANGRDRCVLAKSTEAGPGDPRRRVFKGGRILFNKRMSSMDCTVRSQSKAGAGLEVSSSVGLPNRFELSIESDHVVLPCKVVAFRERSVDVEFG